MGGHRAFGVKHHLDHFIGIVAAPHNVPRPPAPLLACTMPTCVLVGKAFEGLPSDEEGALCVDSRKGLSMGRNAGYFLLLKDWMLPQRTRSGGQGWEENGERGGVRGRGWREGGEREMGGEGEGREEGREGREEGEGKGGEGVSKRRGVKEGREERGGRGRAKQTVVEDETAEGRDGDRNQAMQKDNTVRRVHEQKRAYEVCTLLM